MSKNILILSTVLLIIIAGICFLLLNHNSGIVIKPGQNLTQEQINDSIDIALNNDTVQQNLKNVSYDYTISGVSTIAGRTSDNNYPAVYFKLGKEQVSSGMAVLVDLNTKKVVDIRYVLPAPIPDMNN